MTPTRHGRRRAGANASRRRRRTVWLLIAMPLALVLINGVAWAYWSADSVPGGNGAAAATTVEQGETPTAVAAEGSDVTLDWAASTLANGAPVAGYTIRRYDVATQALQTIQTGCAGAVTTTSCTEADVPTGQWVYSVTPVLGSNWAGAESPTSDAVTTDSTQPVNVITATVVTGNAIMDGTTVFYRGTAAGSFTVTNAVSDSGSGPASSTTSGMGGSSAGWTHTPSTVSSPPSGPYVSNPFTWIAGTTGTATEDVTGRDVAGNAAVTSLSFIDDSAAPTAGTITYPDGYQPGPSVVVDFTSGTDTGSGIATRQLERASAVLSAGVCGTFTEFTAVGPNDPESPYADAQVSGGTCYRYRYVVTDQLGNADTATSLNIARIGSVLVGPHLGSAGTYSVLGGTGVVNTGATSLSGDLGVSPSSSISGFPPGTVAGATHAGDPEAAQAQADLVSAYTDADARIPDTEFAGDQNGQTFHAGIHHSTAAFALTGTMTLDGEGDPNALFIFQIDAAMNTAASSTVNLINGAQPANVYWQVRGAAGTGALSVLSGTIMADGAITLGAGTQLVGRALAYGTITLADNTVTGS